MHALLRRIPCTRGLWALFLERSDVYELHHRTSIVLLGPPHAQWGIKRKKRPSAFRSIDPLSRIPRALDLTRPGARYTRCAQYSALIESQACTACMPCSKKTRLKLLTMQQKNKVETFEGRARAHRAPPWIRLWADCLRVSRDGTIMPCNRLHPTVRRSTREIRISTCSCLLHYSLQSWHMQSTVLIPIKQFTNTPLREVQNSIYSHLRR